MPTGESRRIPKSLSPKSLRPVCRVSSFRRERIGDVHESKAPTRLVSDKVAGFISASACATESSKLGCKCVRCAPLRAQLASTWNAVARTRSEQGSFKGSSFVAQDTTSTGKQHCMEYCDSDTSFVHVKADISAWLLFRQAFVILAWAQRSRKKNTSHPCPRSASTT